MFDSNFIGFNPDSLYSFLPKQKRLKISKKGLNFISNKNSINQHKKKNEFFNINGINLVKDKNSNNQIHNFEVTNYKWNFNYELNNNKPRINAIVSSTGKNFYRNVNGKTTQSSYGRKYSMNNGYPLKRNNEKNNLKINTKVNTRERVKSVKRNSIEKNVLNNKVLQRFINQYETKVKKVLYEIGVVGNIKEKLSKPLSSNQNNYKSMSSKKTNYSERDYNNLPFLGNQYHEPKKHKYSNLQKNKKFYRCSNLNSCSETNIININNFINFFSDTNNITYNSNNNNINNIGNQNY